MEIISHVLYDTYIRGIQIGTDEVKLSLFVENII